MNDDDVNSLIPDYNTMVLSGGGVKGLGILGALQFLADQNKLCTVVKYIGTSVGAIIGYLIAIGYSPIEVMVNIYQKQIIEKVMNAVNVMDLMNHGGAVNFFVLQDILEDMTISKIGHLLTMEQLYNEFGKHLICCTYNHSKGVCEYLDYRNHPKLPCVIALKMSSNFPFLFHPFFYEDSTYIDGALLENFPISQLTEEDIAIGIRLGQPKQKVTTQKHKQQPFDFIQHVFSILSISIEHSSRLSETQATYKPKDTVPILLDLDVFQWSMTMTDKFNAFSVGYETIKNYYQLDYIVPYSYVIRNNVDNDIVKD